MRFCPKRLPWALIFLSLAVAAGWSQAESAATPDDSGVQYPVMRTDSESDSVASSSDPDQPMIEPAVIPSPSYFDGSIDLSTGAQRNPSVSSIYSSQMSSVTSLAGNFSLRKFRRRLETAVDYLGGDTLYSSYASLGLYNQQFQRLSADQTVRWTKGQLSVSDLFSDTGSRGFGSSSSGAVNILPVPPGFDFFGASPLGQVGQVSYVSNISAAQVTEALTKRSSASFSGAYSITDYLNNSEGLFDSRQVSTQTEFTYQINGRNSFGVVYGYQDFEFIPTVETLVTNSMQLVFQHRVFGRMELVLGAGPDYIVTRGLTAKSQVNSTVRGIFTYHAKKADLSLSYNRMVTPGFGYYAGGIADTALFSVERRLSRSWRATLRSGYFGVTELGLASAGTLSTKSEYWLAGVTVHRLLRRTLSAVASYQFNNDGFGTCGLSQGCSPVARSNVALIGLEWSIRPVRLE
jgi:hypothetical protein